VPYKENFDPIKDNDALKTKWGKVNFVNPPYSRPKWFLQKGIKLWKLDKTVSVFTKIFYITPTRKGKSLKLFPILLGRKLFSLCGIKKLFQEGKLLLQTIFCTGTSGFLKNICGTLWENKPPSK